MTPAELRHRIRQGRHRGNTSGLVPGFVQCNLVILPAQYASDFHDFCLNNPKPCPLIAKGEPGNPLLPELGDLDVRRDVPGYRVFRQGEVVDELEDITTLWTMDMVAFALGCSFSFEEALMQAGLDVRNISQGVNVPMYRTNIDCEPAGPFTARLVVSMRPFPATQVNSVIDICARFPQVHGAPIHSGDGSSIGIADLSQPDFGDPVSVHEDEIPLFWACGVTPQVALETARLPLAITHRPGCMLVTDITNASMAESS